MHDFQKIGTWRTFWALGVGVGVKVVESCNIRVPISRLPIHWFNYGEKHVSIHLQSLHYRSIARHVTANSLYL